MDPSRYHLRVAVVGASGYTGGELLGLLARHPAAMRVTGLGAESAGTPLRGTVAPVCAARLDPARFDATLGRLEEAHAAAVPFDVAFLCLPHGAGVDVAEEAARFLARGTKVIDLGDALRADALSGRACPGIPEFPVYGLSEFASDRVAKARLVANPGCYPTSVLLPLVPLARAGLLAPAAPLVVDAKSGVSGAGRKPARPLMLAEMEGNVVPYKIGRAHRHVAEIEGALGAFGVPGGAGATEGGTAVAPTLLFTPHLLPVARGLLSTIYLTLTRPVGASGVRAVIEDAFRGAAFVDVLPEEETASLAHVVRTPRAAISVHGVEGHPDRVIVASAIDNLLKGAASSAVQNFNLMRGAPAAEGLA